jgi:hypothetical protein
MDNKLLIAIVLMLSAFACRKTDSPAVSGDIQNARDPAKGMVVADTIIYDVIIQNPNPDDAWAVQCLEGLNHRLLIDNLFEMVYSGKLIAFDHTTNEKLTPRQVRKIEETEGFRREDIGMIQFTEAWYLHTGELTMTKEVLTMVLGYNYYTPEGERFHKALFRVDLE